MGKNMIKFKVPATSANIGPGFDCLGIAYNFFNEYKVEKSKKMLIEANNEKKRIEDSLRDLWDNSKCTNISIIGVPEEEERA